MDESGFPVDQWVAIKQPRGSQYLYGESLTVSPYSMNDTENGALSHTVKQLWSSDTQAYVVWNDGVPNDPNYSFTYGHTKGLFAFNSDGEGFVLTHSVPSYPQGPNSTKTYLGLGGNAWTYAQSFLCLTVSADTLNAIAYKYLLNRPNIYDFVFPSALETVYGNISSLVQGHYATAKLCAYDTFTTAGGTQFQLFAKTTQWNNDLYSACVAPTLKSTLWTETWIRGSAEPPSCPTTGYDTLDIQGLQFSETVNWSETNDHSKWAIALDVGTVCIGDINRMTTQYERGGGTVCFRNQTLLSTLKQATTGTDSC
jgi:deoxyribonuclease-2